jgi:hypothetical protein
MFFDPDHLRGVNIGLDNSLDAGAGWRSGGGCRGGDVGRGGDGGGGFLGCGGLKGGGRHVGGNAGEVDSCGGLGSRTEYISYSVALQLVQMNEEAYVELAATKVVTVAVTGAADEMTRPWQMAMRWRRREMRRSIFAIESLELEEMRDEMIRAEIRKPLWHTRPKVQLQNENETTGEGCSKEEHRGRGEMVKSIYREETFATPHYIV